MCGAPLGARNLICYGMTKIPSAASSSASNGWSSTRTAWPPPSPSDDARPPAVAATARLNDNAAVLLAAYRASRRGGWTRAAAITPAAEWLLDNYHLVEEQIREIRDDLPPGYYRQLPKLADGPFAGYPRVFGIAWAFVAHTDSRFDPEMLRRFVRAYQSVQPLTIGELWAVAITLRIVLVENLRRVAERIVTSRAARAGSRCASPTACSASTATPAEPGRAARARYERAPLPDGLRRAARAAAARPGPEDHAGAGAGSRSGWQRRARPPTQLVQDEHQRQGASNVTVRNIITSMRLMSDVDWAELFESVSLVDDALRAGSDFAAMDFADAQPLPQRDRRAGARLELSRSSRSRSARLAARTRAGAMRCRSRSAIPAIT